MKLLSVVIASLASIPVAYGNTIYVSPNGSGDQSGSSPENACAGLVAAYEKVNKDDVVTLQLTADTYAITSSDFLTLSKAADVTIAGDAEHPEKVVLDGANADVGFFSTSRKTTLRGLTLQRANVTTASRQAITITSSSAEVVIDSCVFSALTNVSCGAALYSNVGATLTITNCDFTACSSSASGSADMGGAVYIGKGAGSAVFADCRFRDCAANQGGAISGFETLFKCTFVRCSAKYGGAVAKSAFAPSLISNCTFLANSSTDSSGNYGGGAVWMGSDVSIVGCQFLTNTSAKIGGAVHMSSGEATLRDCVFSGNVAAVGCGAASGVAVVEDCRFVGNATTSSDGGALAMTYQKGDGRIMRSTFVGNAAEAGKAAAIYANNKANLLIDTCEFRQNVGKSGNPGGGAIFVNTGSVTIRNSLFAGNEFHDKGGSCVGLPNNTTFPLLVENTTFVSNTVEATVSGHVPVSKGFALSATNCLFYANFDSYGKMMRNFASGQVLDNVAYTASDDDKLIAQPGCFKLTKYPFVGGDDFRLRSRHAELVDKGLSLSWMTADAKDLAGNARVYGAAPDLGCYEWVPKVGLLLLLR